MLGDSFAHMFAPYEDKWGTVLEKHLETRVLKCGVVGYGTRQEYIKAKKIIAMVKAPPKVIVLGYFINDFSEDYFFPSSVVLNGFLVSSFRIADLGTGLVEMKSASELNKEVEAYENKQKKQGNLAGAVRGWVVHNSVLYSSLKKIWRDKLKKFFAPQDSAQNEDIPRGELLYGFLTLPEKKYPWLQKGWDNHYKNLKNIKLLADTYGARLLIVIIPTKEQVYFPERLVALGTDLDAAINKLCAFLKREKIDILTSSHCSTLCAG